MKGAFWIRAARISFASALGVVSLHVSSEQLEQGVTYSPTKDWILVEKNQLRGLTPERQLGDYYVVRESQAATLGRSAHRVKRELTLMEAGPGNFAIADGSVIVIANNQRQLNELILDYSLSIKHTFTAMPAALIQFDSLDSAERSLSELRTDERVKVAELNLKTFSDTAQ